MWTLIKTVRRNLSRAIARTLASAAVVVGVAAATATPSQAQVEYVRICDIFGVGFFYIPGTDTCLQARQVVDNQFAIARANTLSATGAAMAASLVAPYLPTGTNFAISNHWATFDGQHAVGFSGLMRISGNFLLSAGVSTGLDRGSLLTLSERRLTEFGTSVPKENWSEVRALTRAGFMYAW